MKLAFRVLAAILAIAAPIFIVASPVIAAYNGGSGHNGDGGHDDGHGHEDGHGDGHGHDYPPNTAMLTTPTPTTTRGAPLTLIASGFAPGATITFTISQGNQGHDGGNHGSDHSTTVGTKVADANGGATLNTHAPQNAGRYTVTASSPDGMSASLTLTVTSKPDHGHCPDRSSQSSHHDSSGHEQCGTHSGRGSDN